MQYINREYGFEGRPPYFNGYYEKKSKGPASGTFCYPKKGTVGFGLDAQTPNGVLLAGTLGTIWGAKISYQRKGRKWVDTEDFANDLGNLFAESKDGKFVYFNRGDITVNVTRYSDTKLVMIISAISKVRVKLDMYPIAPTNAEMVRIENNTAIGVSKGRAVIPGTCKINDFDTEYRDRYYVEFNESDAKKEYFFVKSYTAPASAVPVDGKKYTFEYALDNATQRVVLFLSVGDEDVDKDVPSLEEIIYGNDKEELIYTAEKIMGSGLLGDGVSDIVSRCNWNRIYDPCFMSSFLIEDRKKFGNYFGYDPTDMATGALVLALTGEYEAAIKQLSICATDYIMGALTSWVIYCRTRNESLLESTLQKFLLSRSINGNLVEADKMTMREIAYKQSGSPLKDIKSEAVYSLDMSCYKLLYLDLLTRMATITKNKALELLQASRNQLKQSINDTLFNEKLGLYMDRYASGEFAGLYTANAFLPLVAGAISDISRLEQLMANLKTNELFGVEHGVPTLPRHHSLFGKKSGRCADVSNGFRGMISPRMNLLIYLGLKRYGVTALHAGLSVSSVRSYNASLKRYGKVAPFFPADRRQGFVPDTANALSGNLMSLIGIMEMLDVEYFKEDLRPALSFGTTVPGEHSLANVEMLGHNFSISISDMETQLQMDGREAFTGTGGRFVVRYFTENFRGTEFVIDADADITINVVLPIFTRANENRAPVTFNVEKGKTRICINRKNKVEISRLGQ